MTFHAAKPFASLPVAAPVPDLPARDGLLAGSVFPGRSLGAMLLGSTLLMAPSVLRAQDVVADGRTATSIASGAAGVDVTTGTVHNGLGFNSFSRLNVAEGATVNIHAPAGTSGTVNLVRDHASVISGTLNGLVNGTVGGTMVLANPNGIVVGPNGQVNAGAVHLSTPDAGFMDSIIGPTGQVAQAQIDRLIDGTAPRAADADIVIDGQINAPAGVTLRAGRDVVVGTTEAAGRRAAVSSVANTGGRRAIVLDGGRSTVVRGTVTSRQGGAGGDVQLRARDTVHVIGTIDVSGTDNGAGGTITLFGETATYVDPAAAVLARGAGLGDGGRITIQAADDLALRGRITAAAASRGATAGEVVISGTSITLRDNLLVEGSHLTLDATDDIQIRLETVVSTRATADPAAAQQPFSVAAGDAGDLTLRAPVIFVGEAASLLATGGTGADGTVFAGGALRLEARSVTGLPGLFTVASRADITLDRGARLIADSVTISAIAESRLTATSLADLAGLGDVGLPPLATALAQHVVDQVVAAVDPVAAVLPVRLTARAFVASSAGTIRAQAGDVTISAHAVTDAQIAGGDDARLGVVAVQTETVAEVDLFSSARFFPQTGYSPATQLIEASGDVAISASTQETQNLAARAGGTALAPALVLSDRVSRAQVRWLRGFDDPVSGPSIVMNAGGAQITAESRRDIRLSAAAVQTDDSGLAPALAISRQDGTARVDLRGDTDVTDAVTVAARTVYDRLQIDTTARQAQGAALPAGASADPEIEQPDALDAQLRGIGAVLETLSETGAAVGGLVGAETLALAGSVVAHDDTTLADVSGRIRAAFPDDGLGGVPPVAGPVAITADLTLGDLRITTAAGVDDPDAAALAVNAVRLDGETAVTFSGEITATGDVTLAARTTLPGAGQTTAADPASIAALGAGQVTLDAAGALPDLTALLPQDHAQIVARTTGPNGARAASASVVLGRLAATTAMARADFFAMPTIMGVGYVDPETFEFFDGLTSRITVQATQAGALVNRAGQDGAETGGRGAAVAVTALSVITDAHVEGRLQTRLLDVLAQPALHLATVAVPGAGSGVTGGVAVSAMDLVTRTDLARGTVLIAGGPDGVGTDDALVLRADDATRLITLAGGVNGGAASGFAAAFNRTTRDVTAAYGNGVDVIYDTPEFAAFYGDRPFVFDDTTPVDPFAPLPRIGSARVAATSSGAVITAAAAGRPDGPVAGAAGNPLRPLLDRAGGLSLTGELAFGDWNIGAQDALDYAGDALGGFRYAGAFAGNAGNSTVTAYAAPQTTVQVAGDVIITAQDAADILALTGALVPQAAPDALAGGFAVGLVDRSAATRVYGSSYDSGGSVTLTADIAGRDVAVGGSAAGSGLNGAGIAASGAVLAGARDALVRLGSVDVAAVDRIAVQAQDSGQVLAAGGAAQTVNASGAAQSDVGIGIGLAAAADLTQRASRVDLARFAGRPDQGLAAPDPVVSLSASDGPVSVQARSVGDTVVLARSAGAGDLAASGAIAVGAGKRTASVDLAADLVLSDTVGISAQAAGTSRVQAGADAAQADIGAGIATAVQAEQRLAAVTVTGATVAGDRDGGRREITRATITAQVDGQMRASATAGTAADGADLTVNGAVAVNAGQQDATVTLLQGTDITARDLTIRADIAAGARRTAEAGQIGAMGAGIGFGLGLALDLGRGQATISGTGASLTGTAALTLLARNLGQVDVRAVNGALDGDGLDGDGLDGETVAGVNLAGGLAISGAEVALRGGSVTAPMLDIAALVTGGHDARADSAQIDSTAPGDGTTTRGVAAVAALAVDADAMVTLDGVAATGAATGAADRTGDGSITITARSEPGVTTRSSDVDALRINFAQAAAVLDEDGREIRPAMRNLDLAAAATGIATDAQVLINASTLDADRVALAATAIATADSVGLLDAGSDITLRDTVVTGRNGVTAASEARATVTALDTLTSARGADLRAAEAAHADLAEAAAAAAASEDSGVAADFALTITPEAARAKAGLLIADSTILADGADDAAIDLSTLSVTDVTLGAAGTGLSATVAVTDTSALTQVQDSRIAATGALSVTADVVERQNLTARAAADGNGVAGTLSVRRASAMVAVDNAADDTGLFGGSVAVTALTTRDLRFDASATMSADGDAAVAAVVSFGDAVTSATLGGRVVAGAGTGDFLLSADTLTNLQTHTVATIGAAGDAPIGTGLPPLTVMADRLRQIATAIELRNLPSDRIDAVADYAASARLSLGLIALGQQDSVTARLGGTGLSPAFVTAGQARVQAASRTPTLRLRNRAHLGLPGDPEAPEREAPAVATLTLYAQRGRVNAGLGQGALVAAPDVTVTALTALPTTDLVADADALRGLADRNVTAADGVAAAPGAALGDGWALDQTATAAEDAARLAADAALFAIDLSTIADLSGHAAADRITLDAQTTGTLTLRAGGSDAAPAGQVGVGAGIAAALLREDTATRITDTAERFDTGTVTQATATSGLGLLAIGQSKALAAAGAFNGGLGVVATDRRVTATLDPAARIAGDITLGALDQSVILVGGLAQASSGALSLGLSGAMIFGTSVVEALYGRRDATTDALVDVALTGTNVGQLTLTARDDSLLSTLSTAGAGTAAGQDIGGFSIATTFSTLVDYTVREVLLPQIDTPDLAPPLIPPRQTSGPQLAQTIASDAVGAGGWFGLGASGAASGVFGQTTVAALAHGTNLGPQALSLNATDASDIVALAGGSVTGARVNGAAGAAAITERNSTVAAAATGLVTSGAVTLNAQSLRDVQAMAASAKGRGLSALALAGSVALDRSTSTVTAQLDNARLGPADGAHGAAVTVNAATLGRMQLLAGGAARGSGFVAGISSAENRGSSTTRALILNAPLIRVEQVTVSATMQRGLWIAALSSADAGVVGLVSLAGAQALDRGDITVEAGLTGGAILARDTLRVTAMGGGDTSIAATRDDLAGLTAGQGGGVRADHDATRLIRATAVGGQFAVEGALPDVAELDIMAQDGGALTLSTLALVQAAAPGGQINVNVTQVARRGEVAARLGAPMIADPATDAMPAPTALAVLDADGLAQVTATDARDVVVRPVTISGAIAGGLQVAASIIGVDDSRAVRAELRDLLVLGAGRAGAVATRTGSITATSLLGGVNILGLGAASGNAVFLASSGEVAARVQGTQLGFGAGFGGLSATATDSGQMRATALELSYANIALGLRLSQIDLTRAVLAEVGDSATRVMALPVTGAITAAALGDSLVSAPGFVASGGLTADLGAVITALAAERDVFAAAGGAVFADSVTVTATRSDTLRVLDADLAVAGGLAALLRTVIIRHGGATEAVLRSSGATQIAGAASVTALDTSTILAATVAGAFSPGGAGVVGDLTVVLVGGRDDLPELDTDAGLAAGYASAQAAEAQAGAAITGLRAPVTTAPNPFTRAASSGATIARVEGADLAAEAAAALDIREGLGRADIAGDLTLLATTDMNVSAITGQVSAASGAAVTVGAAILTRRTRTAVDTDLGGLSEGLFIGGALDATALSAGQSATLAFGVASGGTGAGAGSLAFTMDNRQVAVSVTGARITARSIRLAADTRDDVGASALNGGVGGTGGIGIGLALALDDRDTAVDVTDAALVSTTVDAASPLTLRSRAEGETFAVAFAAGIGAQTGVGAAVAIALRSGDTRAQVQGSALTAAHTVVVAAETDAWSDTAARPSVTAVILPVAGSGSLAVAAGLVSAFWEGTTTVTLTDSTVTAGRDLYVDARSNADVLALSIGASVGGQVGVAGSNAISSRRDTVSALISGGMATANGSVVVLARSATGSEAFSGGATTGDEDDTTDAPSSSAPARLAALNVNIGVGGVFGGGVSVAATTIAGTVTAAIDAGASVLARSQGAAAFVPSLNVDADVSRGASNTQRLGVVVLADSFVSQTGLSLVGGFGGIAGLALQISQLSLAETVVARIGGDGARTSVTTGLLGRVAVQGQASARLNVVNVGVAGAGKVGVGAVVNTVSLTRDVAARIVNADVVANRSLSVVAQVDEKITSADVAGGGGGIAGVAGAVTVLDLNNTVAATVGDAAITVRDAMTVDARLDRDLTVVTAGAGLGIGVGTGGVQVTDIRDVVLAELADAPDPVAPATEVTGNVTVQAGSLAISAQTDQRLSVQAGLVAGGVGALQGVVSVLALDTDVRARVGNHTVFTTRSGASGNVAVTAETIVNPRSADAALLAAGQLAIVGFGYGATVAVLSARAVTEAEIGRNAALDAANGTIEVKAVTDRDMGVDAGAFGLALGGTVQVLTALTLLGDSAGGANGVDFLNDTAGDLAADTTLDALDDKGQSDDLPAELAEGEATRRAAGTRVMALTADDVASDADRTVARVQADATLGAARGVFVGADDLTRARVKAGGLGLGGGLSAIAGVAHVRVNSTIDARVLAGARITSGAGVGVAARLGTDARTSVTEATSFAGAVGLVNGAAAIASGRAKSSRVISALIARGATVTAETAVNVTADQTAQITATTEGFAAGAVAASVMISDATDQSQTTATLSGTVSGADVTVAAGSSGATLAALDTLNLSLGFGGSVLRAAVTEASRTQARLTGAVTATGAVTVAAVNSRDVTADAKGVAISALFAIGGTTARVSVTRSVLADLTSVARITAQDLTLRALQDGADFTARARNGGGALGGGVIGSDARVTVNGSVRASGLAAGVTLTGDALIDARSTQTLTAQANSKGLGLLGAGGSADARVNADMDTEAAIQTGGTIAGQLTLAATGDELLTAAATGSAGGLVGVAGAATTITSRSDTTAGLGSRPFGFFTGLTAGRLDVATDHRSRFAPSSDAIGIAALGLGGATSIVDIATDSGIRMAAGARITARDIAMLALSRLSRVVDARSAQAGSGGGIGTIGAHADHSLTNDNRVDIANGAVLRQTASTVNGGIAVSVISTTIATPSVSTTTIETVSLPRADATAAVTNRATVTLGDGAQVLGQGTVVIGTATSGRVVSTANADTVSAGSRITAAAAASYTAVERIALQNGAVLDGGRSVTLQTGGIQTVQSLAEVAATATYRSQSVVPLDRKPQASILLDLTSVIDVGAGAAANAGGQMVLATRGIEADALVTAFGRNLWRDTAEVVGNALADVIGIDARIDLDVIGTETAVLSDDTGTTVHGTVRSGTAANRTLAYDEAGVLTVDGVVTTPAAASLPVTITTVGATALRAEILAGLEADRAIYAAEGRDDLVQVLDLQIAELTAALAVLVDQAPGGVIEVLRLGDIQLDGADIAVTGGYLLGAGELRPTTDIAVNALIERAGAVVILGDIGIPDQPGAVVLNGLRMGTSAAVNAQNARSEAAMFADRDWQVGAPAPVILGWDTTPAALTITSAANAQGGVVDVAVTEGDLFATGRIANRAGSVTLSADDTLVVQGNIIAQSVTLNAPNVFVGLTPGLRNIADDPQARLFARADGPSLTDNEIASLANTFRGFTPADLDQGTPAILAQNVAIYGDWVNVNGRIEAGGPALAVSIGVGTDAWIDSTILSRPDLASLDRVQIHSPFAPDPASGITGNIPVYFNPATNRIEFDPIVAEGGQVRIAGKIISTGNGQIVALDGFSDIAITSDSARVLRFDRVDTGGETGVAGQVELLDLRKGRRTVYRGIDTPVGSGATRRDIQRQVFTLPAVGNPGSVSAKEGTLLSTATIAADGPSGQRQAQYDIVTINGAVPFIDYAVRATHTGSALSPQTRVVADPTISERALAGSAYYDYARSPAVISPVAIVNHTHSFRANEPVTVELRGNPTGSVVIDAAGMVEFTGLVRSEGAGLAVTAGGAIQGIGGAALLRASQISLISQSGGSISAGAGAVPDSTVSTGGSAPTLADLLGPNLGTLVVSDAILSATRLRNGSVFTGLALRPERPEAPLQLHLTTPRIGGAAGVTALSGNALTARGTIALEARDSNLALTRIEGRNVALTSGRSILRAGGDIGAGRNGLEVRATRDLSLTAGSGGIGDGFALRFDIGDGRLRASAGGDIALAHAPDAALGTGTLRVDSVASLTGSVTLTSQGRILDDNGEGFANRVTEEQALADFWTVAGLLGDERAARITAENDTQRAARLANLDFYWQVRARFDGAEPDKTQEAALFAEIEAAAIGAGLTAAEAAQEVARLQDSYAQGRDLSDAADPDATTRPDVDIVLTPAEINAIASLNVTAAELDVGLRSDYALATPDTEVEVERPNISAAGPITIRAGAVGENSLVARVLTAASGPVTPQAGVTDFDVTTGVPRDLLVLLATSEPGDITPRGAPTLRTDIFRAQDLDLRTDNVVNVILHGGQAASADVSAFVGSEETLRFNALSARDQARVKAGGSILGFTPNAPGVTGTDIVLEAAAGRIGLDDSALRVNAPVAGDSLTLDARAGGRAGLPGSIHIRRDTVGDVLVGGILASDAVVLDVAGGSILARDDGSFLRGDGIALTATGSIGQPLTGQPSPQRALTLDSGTAVLVNAGTGVSLHSVGTLRAASIGATTGRVRVQVDAGDLILQGPLADPDDTASRQFAPALYANTAITTGVSAGPHDLTLDVQNGRVLDQGSDRPTTEAEPFVVPDIQAGRLVLFTGGFGTADNAIETDIGFVRGTANAGLFLTNDRRQQPGNARGLLLDDLTALSGDIRIRQRDALTLASGGHLRAGGDVVLTLPRETALTLSGDVTLTGADVVLDAALADVMLTVGPIGQGRRVNVNGNLTVTARSMAAGDFDADLSSAFDGVVSATGDIDLRVTEGVRLRNVTGRNVAVTTPGTAGIALQQVTAGEDVTLSARNSSRADAVIAGGDVTIGIGAPGVISTLSLFNLQAGGVADVRANGLAHGGVIMVAARRLTGDIGTLQANTILQLRGAVQLNDFTFGGGFGPAARLEALGGQLDLVGDVRFGDIRIEALSVQIAGQTRTGDLDMVAVDGLTLLDNAHLDGDAIAITTGVLGGDFLLRPADVTMAATARMTAFDALTIAASGTARITGLQSTATAPVGGIGIDITAARITEAGDDWIDLTTRDGVAARLRAEDLTADALTGLETQVGALDIVVDRGDIALRQVGDLTVQQARTAQGRIDIFTFGDLIAQAAGQGLPVIAGKDSVILTATGNLFTTAPQGGPVGIETRRLFLGAIDGSVGTNAAPVAFAGSVDSLAVFAGRHIVGDFDLGAPDVPLLAADTGAIDVRFGATGPVGIVTAAGPLVAENLSPYPLLSGVYDTRPSVEFALEQARYPLRRTRSDTDGLFDRAGLDSLPGDPLIPRDSASDGAVLLPGERLLSPGDVGAPGTGEDTAAIFATLKARARDILTAARNGLGLPGAAATAADNPLQPFGTALNRLRPTGPGSAEAEEELAQTPLVTVAEDLKR